MPDDDKTFSQADVDRFVAEERRRNKEALDALTKERDDVVKERDTQTALVQERDTRYAEIEKNLNDTSRDRDRFKVALDAGLPTALAARLQGDTEDELRADADTLKTFVGKEATPDKGTGKLPGPKSDEPEPQTMSDLIRSAAGR